MEKKRQKNTFGHFCTRAMSSCERKHILKNDSRIKKVNKSFLGHFSCPQWQPGVTQPMLSQHSSQATSNVISTWVGDHLGCWSIGKTSYAGTEQSQCPSGLERVRLIVVGLPAGVGVRARAQSLIVIVTQWHHRITQPMLSSYSESTDVERESKAVTRPWMVRKAIRWNKIATKL